jgi:hypothetical protein
LTESKKFLSFIQHEPVIRMKQLWQSPTISCHLLNTNRWPEWSNFGRVQTFLSLIQHEPMVRVKQLWQSPKTTCSLFNTNRWPQWSNFHWVQNVPVPYSTWNDGQSEATLAESKNFLSFIQHEYMARVKQLCQSPKSSCHLFNTNRWSEWSNFDRVQKLPVLYSARIDGQSEATSVEPKNFLSFIQHKPMVRVKQVGQSPKTSCYLFNTNRRIE